MLTQMKRKWKEDHKGLVGLEYVVFKNVPMRQTEHGPIIDLEPGVLEALAARAIIEHRVPLRGKEVRFLRKALGLSMEKFAGKLDLTSGAVFKWEKDPEQRLHPVNEVVVRAYVAEALDVEVSGKYSQLLGHSSTPDKIILKAG